MELMKALDAGEDLETKVNDQQLWVEQTKDAEQAWKLEVWQKMLVRIRKMESMLNQPNDPKS
jgi:hypothetical protein